MYPSSYLKKPLSEILSNIGMSIPEFNEICDQFTNREIFATSSNGSVIKDKTGRPLKKSIENG
jgi:hypothetical protein